MPTIDPELLVPDHITTHDLATDYPAIQLTNKFGSATIALHGAHVIDYTPADQRPVLFTSEKAVFKEGKAIRGGVPVCWPWFNAHPTDSSLPSHGYARVQFWKLIASSHSDDLTTITLGLSIDTLRAKITIKLNHQLKISLHTTNISDKPRTVGGALHSYFALSNISNATLYGLDDTEYLDTVNNTPHKQVGDVLIKEETDRIYENTSATVRIHDAEWNRDIAIQKSGSLSTVVWNPWIDKSLGMADLDSEDYKQFVCVEAANARANVYKIAPGASHTLATTITSLPR